MRQVVGVVQVLNRMMEGMGMVMRTILVGCLKIGIDFMSQDSSSLKIAA
jgi:hypothetical protein